MGKGSWLHMHLGQITKYIYSLITACVIHWQRRLNIRTQWSPRSDCRFAGWPWPSHIKHYENTPIQIYRKFHLQKTENFQIKNSDISHISAQNIDCGYSLELPRRGSSNEYPQSMFWAEIRKIIYTPVKTPVLLYKSGV